MFDRPLHILSLCCDTYFFKNKRNFFKSPIMNVGCKKIETNLEWIPLTSQEGHRCVRDVHGLHRLLHVEHLQ